MTGWPSILDKGSASVRAAMSGVEPPGKPTKIRTGLVGQTAIDLDVSDTFWAEAPKGKAHAATQNVATIKLKRGIFTVKASSVTTQSFVKNYYLNSFTLQIAASEKLKPVHNNNKYAYLLAAQ